MRTIVVILTMLILLCSTACRRKDSAQQPLDPNEERLKALYAQQDAIYGDRYAASEAAMDIDRGTPKLYWLGFPRAHDSAWSSIIQKRFSVKAEFVAGCEFSPHLGNYADAYNLHILNHIAKNYGPTAFAESEQEAIVLLNTKTTTVSQP